jgi:DMSO reductase family type II enzyme chaperone
MDDVTMPVISTADPIARSAMYRLLSLAFRFPTAEVFARYQNGEYLSELLDRLSVIPHLEGLSTEEAGRRQEVQEGLRGLGLEDFRVRYTSTFDVGAPEPPCPPYEGVYLKGVERTGFMIRLSEFYRRFGLGISQEEGKRELPDHLSAELEFLHFLAFKEAQARSDPQHAEFLHGYLLAQRDFIQHHLTVWLPDFATRLGASSPIQFFAWMGRLVAQVAPLELAYLNEELEFNP